MDHSALQRLLHVMWLHHREDMYAQRDQLEKRQRGFHSPRTSMMTPLNVGIRTNGPMPTPNTAVPCRPGMRLLSPLPTRSQMHSSLLARDVEMPTSQSVARRLAKVVANYVVKGELDLDRYVHFVQEEIEELLERDDSESVQSSTAGDSPLLHERILHFGQNFSENV